MKWTKNKSLCLSKVSIILFLLALVGASVAAPWLMGGWLGKAEYLLPFYLTTVYFVAIIIVIILIKLYQLLHNIGNENVFISENVRCLRMISWACIFAGGILCISGIYDHLFYLMGAFAAFVGLIVRIVKNVIEEAVELKAENDYTI